MICGHKHVLSVDDALGQPCPVVVASKPMAKENYFAGSGFIFNKNSIEVVFNHKDKILETHRI